MSPCYYREQIFPLAKILLQARENVLGFFCFVLLGFFNAEIEIGLKCFLDLMLLVIDETMKMKEEIIRDCWVFKGDLQTKGNPRD